jgi:hexokinase
MKRNEHIYRVKVCQIDFRGEYEVDQDGAVSVLTCTLADSKTGQDIWEYLADRLEDQIIRAVSDYHYRTNVSEFDEDAIIYKAWPIPAREAA